MLKTTEGFNGADCYIPRQKEEQCPNVCCFPNIFPHSNLRKKRFQQQESDLESESTLRATTDVTLFDQANFY